MIAPILFLTGNSGSDPFGQNELEEFPVLRVTAAAEAAAMLPGAALVCCDWSISRDTRDLLLEARRYGRPSLCVLGPAIPWEETTYIPVDRVACVGPAQARQFESFGSQCEVIGHPPFDVLLRHRGNRPSNPKPRVLLWADPGDPDCELFQYIVNGTAQGEFYADFVVPNSDADTVPIEELRLSDALITTSPAALLPAMLLGMPAALASTSVRPPAIQPAWRIPSERWMEKTVRDLLVPSPVRMLFQDTILHDTLACESPALPRRSLLITELIRRQESSGDRLHPPRRLVPRPHGGHHPREERFRLEELFRYPEWLESDQHNLRTLIETRSRYATPLTQPPLPPEDIVIGLSADCPSHLDRNSLTFLELTVSNGSQWPLRSAGEVPVHASYQWRRSDGWIVVGDGIRTPINLSPRETRAIEMKIMAPSTAGEYDLIITLVQEQRFWFHSVNPTFALHRRVAIIAVE